MLLKKSGLEKKKIEDNLKEFLKASAHYRIQNLPIDNRILKGAKFISYSGRLESGAVNAIPCLTLNVAINRVFHEAESTKYDLVDIVKRQFMEYQTEIILEHVYLKNQQGTSGLQQPSYWRAAYGIAGVELETKYEESTFKPVDDYRFQIYKLQDEEGKVKYKQLYVLLPYEVFLSINTYLIFVDLQLERTH